MAHHNGGAREDNRAPIISEKLLFVKSDLTHLKLDAQPGDNEGLKGLQKVQQHRRRGIPA